MSPRTNSTTTMTTMRPQQTFSHHMLTRLCLQSSNNSFRLCGFTLLIERFHSYLSHKFKPYFTQMKDWKVVKLFCVADSSLLTTLLNLTCTTLRGEEAKVSLTSSSKSCVIDDHPCPVKHLRKSNQVSIEEKKSCLTVSNTILG